MKRALWALPFMLPIALLGACTTVAPDAGFEAVIVRKPFVFGHGGVDETPVKTGRSYFAMSTSAIYVDVRPIQFQEHFEDLMSLDGVPLDFDAALRLQVTNSVAVIRDFGPEWYQRNVSAVFRKLVRDAVKQHSMNATAISASAAEEIDANVSSSLARYLSDAALQVRLIDVTLGRANPPDAIKHQRVATAEQEQRSNTEKQRKLAEDQRKEAEAARAAADNAYREAMRLSPDQFLQLEQIKMLHEVCGGGKCTFVLGNGAVPTLNVR